MELIGSCSLGFFLGSTAGWLTSYGFNVVNDGFGGQRLQNAEEIFIIIIFFVELSRMYPFFIISDALQLFLHVKRDALFNHEAAKYKHIKF